MDREDNKDMAPKGMVYVCPECKAKFNFLPRGDVFCTMSHCSGARLRLVKDKPKGRQVNHVRVMGHRY